jgi:hypothetical protein
MYSLWPLLAIFLVAPMNAIEPLCVMENDPGLAEVA